MKQIAPALAASLMLASSCVSAGPGHWTGGGPWGGSVYEVVPRPGLTGSTTVYAVAQSGLFLTIDAGLSWTSEGGGIPGGLSILNKGTLTCDDINPNRMFVLSRRGRVVRSTDAGGNWGDTAFLPPEDAYPIALADVPGNSTDMYLGLGARSTTTPEAVLLLKSTDGGDSFVTLGGGLPEGRSWYIIAVDSTNPNRVLAGARNETLGTTGVPAPPSLYLSVDAGATWTGTYSAPYEDYVARIDSIAFGAGDTVYATVEFQLFRSDDNGVNWVGPLQFGIRSVLPDPTDPLTVLLSSGQGLDKSTDGGVTLTPINAGLTPMPGYTSTTTGLPVPALVTSVSADSTFPAPGGTLWAATDGGGVFRSLDNGANWQSQNAGLASVKIRALAVHPNPSTPSGPGAPGRRIYAGIADTFISSPGIFLTTDLGTTWQATNTGLRTAQVRALAVDPTTAGLTAPDIASSHIYASGRSSQLLGYRNGGLYKSINGGITWSTIDAGLPTRTQGPETFVDLGTVRFMTMDPRSCTIPLQPVACSVGPLQRIYATADGFPSSAAGVTTRTHRIIRSDDAGASWTSIEGNLPVSESSATSIYSVVPLPLVVSPTNPDVLFVGTFSRSLNSDGSPPEDRQTGVFKSVDGGTTWTQASNGLPRRAGFSNFVLDVLAMAGHPTNPNILWATIFDSYEFAPGDIPLYKTTDGGATWTPSAAGLPPGIDLRAIIVDRSDPDTLYVGGYFPTGDDGSGSFSNPPGIYKSTDGGATWLSISTGLRARVVLDMTIDPFYASVLHLGTDSGVWTIEQVPDADGDGVPDDVENLAPNQGDGDFDGIADSIQGSVGSTVVLFGSVNILSDLKTLATMKGAGGFVTSKVQPVQGNCGQAVDVEVLLAARFGRDFAANGAHFHSYPRNLARFEVLDCQAANVDLIFHGANFVEQEGWTFRLYGPPAPGNDADVGWHDISARAQVISPTTWRLNLDADEPGSFRLDSGSILFMGGPACLDERIFEGVFESNWVRPPSCQ